MLIACVIAVVVGRAHLQNSGLAQWSWRFVILTVVAILQTS